MRELLKLREWLSLEEAAQHLTDVRNETVLVKDIYRLALDGHLLLSINFLDEVLVKKIEHAEVVEERELADGSVGPDGFRESIIFESDFSKAWDHGNEVRVYATDGIWNLRMVGGETLIVEQHYQKLAGGIDLKSMKLERYDVFIENDYNLYQLQDSYDNFKFTDGSLAQQKVLEEEIANNDFSSEEVTEIWEKWWDEREEYMETRSSMPIEHDCYPAISFPENSVLVVRVSAITDFLTSLGEGNGLVKGGRDNSVQERREEKLVQLIELRGEDEVSSLGRLGAWNELTKSDKDLFSRRESSLDSTLKKFFDNQRHITFKRGRIG